MNNSNKRLIALIGLLILWLFLTVPPIIAQVVPSMILYVNWTPDQQLTTFDDNGINGIEADEIRYVHAQFMLDGNVQFWALDLNCRIGNGAQLELVDVVFPETTWGISSEFLVTPDTNSMYTNGVFAFTITRVGVSNTPVGINGADYTTPIVTAQFKVKETVTTNIPVLLTQCQTGTSPGVHINFLNRDGRLVKVGTQGRFTHLGIFVGYILNGRALRQGAPPPLNHNIEVECEYLADNTKRTAFTNAAGFFTFNNGSQLRDYGLYECVYRSDLDKDGVYDAAFLEARSLFNLQTPRYTLQPVTIRPGDYDDDMTPDGVIDLMDLTVITGNFGQAVPRFTKGDANGNLVVQSNDLALVAGNVDLTDLSDPILTEHVLYSLGTDYNAIVEFPNSRVHFGTPESGPITPHIRAVAPDNVFARDFWATLSPDGSEYAYIFLHNAAFGNEHKLRTSNAPLLTLPPPGFPYPEALAPSWSPDGNQIAWICTVDEVDAGLQFNEGAICVANRLTLPNALANITIIDPDPSTAGVLDAEIFPPAWFSYPYDNGQGFALIYTVDDTIRYYDLVSGTQGVVPGDSAGTTLLGDMPVVINHFSDDSFLFYRTSDQIQVARLADTVTYCSEEGDDTCTASGPDGLSFDGFGFGGAGTTGGTLNANHMVVDNSTGVEYYDVSPLLDIMFYDDTEFDLQNLLYNGAGIQAGSENWALGTNHFVDGNIGSPTWQSGPGGGVGIPWDGSDDTPTELHAHRVTFDWVP